VSEPRNTPEAPALPRCTTCGASRIDGHGEVTPYRPEDVTTGPEPLMCDDCANGVDSLLKEDSENYEWDAQKGQLHRKTEDPWVTARDAEFDQLAESLTRAVSEADLDRITVEREHGVAVILPNGYRWHVFTPRTSRFPGEFSTILFTADRDWTNPPVMLPLTGNLHDTCANMILILRESLSGEIQELIEKDAFARLEIQLFDPDQLLS